MKIPTMQSKWISKIASTIILISCSLTLNAQNIHWHSFSRALSKADSTNKPVLVDISAPWCGWCHKLKDEVYPTLDDQLNSNFITTNINRDNKDARYRYKGESLSALRLSRKFKANTVPTIAFLRPDGSFLFKISGFIKAEKLKPLLQYVSTKSYNRMNFQDYKKNHIASFGMADKPL